MTLLLVFLLTSCDGCAACKPHLPAPPNTDTNQNKDTSDSGDSGDTSDSGDSTDSIVIDTTPPPLCDVPEVEPNGITTPQTLPLDEWACGTFDSNGNTDTGDGIADPEAFRFAITQADWVRVEVEAASIGSSADVSMNFIDPDDGEYAALVYASSTSTDPYLAFPSDKARNFLAILSESSNGYGEAYPWRMMATVTKPPITWNKEEVEPNDPVSTSPHYAAAQPLASGDVVFAKMDEHADIDTYAITIPDDGAQYTINATVVAANKGSPADMYMILYDPTERSAKSASSGVDSYDRDPLMTYTVSTPGTWTLLLRESADQGSAAYWYVLSLTLTRIAPDTGTTDTSGSTTTP